MGIFGKEKEYIDYTLLKKKGLLKIKEQESQKNLKTEGGFVDFTSLASTESPANTAETNTSNFGFLSDMAGIGSASSQTASPLANFDNANPGTSLSGKELDMLKVKIDDMEYKLDRFIERLDKLEEKLARQGNF